MSNGAGSGDRLARGAHRAQFMTTEGGVSEDKWAAAFEDFDAEAFKNEPNKSSVRSGAGLQESGILDPDFGAVEPGEPTTL
jgi:hypothetical protein